MGKAKNNKTKNSALNKTTANLPNSQESGQTCEPENKRPTQTPKTTTPFSTAGIQDKLEFEGMTSFFGGGMQGRIAGRGDLSQDAEISAGVSHAAGQF